VSLTAGALGAGDRTTRRALRTHVADRDEPLVRLVGSDLPVRAVDQLVDLHRERVDPRPRAR